MSEDLNNLKIYDALNDLTEYLEGCKQIAFSGENIRKVDIGRVMDILADINICLPEDIRRAQSIIDEATSIIDNAQTHADAMLEQAQKSAKSAFDRGKLEGEKIVRDAENKREQLLAEHEITKEAERRKDEMIEQTRKFCCDLYDVTKTNAEVLLTEAEEVLHRCVKAVRSERDRVKSREEDTRYNHADDSDDSDAGGTAAADYSDEESEGYEEVEADLDERGTEKPRGERKHGIGKIFDVIFPKDDDYDDGNSDTDDSFDDDGSVD